MIACGYLTVFAPLRTSIKCRIMPTASIELGKLPEWMEVGKHLSKARRQKGLKQLGLAEKCGLRQGEISAFESGRRHPTLAQMTELARALDMPLQWLITGAVEPPGTSLNDLTMELRHYGLADLPTEKTRIVGACRPLEQLLCLALKGDAIPNIIVESYPYLLASTKWRSRLVLAYAKEVGDGRVLTRLGWLADIARTLHKAGDLPEAENQRGPLFTLTKKAPKGDKSDSLGHPAGDFATVTVINMRWNITYDGSAEAFKKRTMELRALKPTGIRE
jgi:transcriptional regulator with XRE-family HTH domain